MGGAEWSAEENALVIFFASAGVIEKIIPDLLERRGYSRSLSGVRYKIKDLKINERLGGSRQWHQDTVDAWLSRYLRRCNVEIAKLQPTREDQAIVEKAQASIDLTVIYQRLSQRIERDFQEEWMGALAQFP